jgi:hypothetical protein
LSVGFNKDCERRKVRLYFSDGEIAEGVITDIADPDDGDEFAYDPIPLKSEAPALWAKFEELEKYELLES